MNTNPVVSLNVAADLSGHEGETLKLTSTGVNLAGTGDRIIGTLLRAQTKREDGGSAVGRSAAVFLTIANGFHLAKIGNNTAIAMGDELERDTTSGRLVKKVSGVAVAIAVDPAPVNSDGGLIQVIFLPEASAGIEPVVLTGATLTDNSGGTADTTLAVITSTTPADLTAVGVQLVVIKNNFADLAAAVNKNTADILAINTAISG